MDMVRELSSKGDLDDDGLVYQSMLISASKLFDIFEKAGDALRLYCSSIHQHVPPHKVLTDVATILKNAGCALEPRDLDLRDCYRACPELKRASVFKLSGPESPNYKYLSSSSRTRTQGFGAAIPNYPYRGNCPLFNKIKSGPVLSFRPSASEPRLLSTVAGHVENGVSSCILQKHMAYIAFRLKKGIKF
ncbi:uncharacterized protein LOC141646478 [Silene latifolia]|uniref:uncharacterized protein LOC141646478 n=1 Tax=Silene latifolia TaxID=37657 RepID=UPI003D784973